MKNMIRLIAAASAALTLGSGLAAAQVAVDFDNPAAVRAPLSGGDLGSGFKALGKRVAAENAQPRAYAIPRDPQDAFQGVGGCNVIDAVYLRAFSLDEAVNVLAPCMHTLSQKYAAGLTAEKAFVALGDGSQAPGIVLRLDGPTFIGNHVLTDLRQAIELRHGRLLGFPADVADGAAFSAMTSPANTAAVPAWIDAASLRIEPGQTRVIGVEGGLRVVMFDRNDDQVEFVVPTAQRPGASVEVTFTKADDSQAGPFSVDQLRALNPGELGRLVSGVTVPSGLDARTRAAVEGLLASLRAA